MSPELWAFLGIIVAAWIAPTWLAWWNSRITKRETQQINRAVNHVGEGEPTLIERVRRIERETALHRKWEAETFSTIASQVGVTIAAPPESHELDKTHP